MFSFGQHETSSVVNVYKKWSRGLTAGRSSISRSFEHFSAAETAVIGLI